MSPIPWKKEKVISIDSGAGFFYLIEMLDEPYVAVFRRFQSTDDWKGILLSSQDILFIKAVTRQFISKSTAKTVDVAPLRNIPIPELWIGSHHGSRIIKVFEGTSHERSIMRIEGRPGGRLLKKSKKHSQQDIVVNPEIPLDDTETIEKYELANIDIYPNLNERIILCQRFGRNIDPDKDMKFNKKLPIEYIDYINKIMPA